MEDTAVNMAHRYANYAEECMENNQWEQAVDMHFQAAEHFLLATKDTQNQEVIRTLKLMNANHIRQAKDLQRRITKAAAAQAAAAAAAEALAAATLAPQQKPTSTRIKMDPGGHSSGVGAVAVTLTPSAAGGVGRRRGSEGHHQSRSEGQRQRHLDPLFQKTLGDHGNEVLSRGGDAGSGGSYLGTSSEASSNSSSAMIEESFTLIKNHVKDESDPFNKFWDAVENLVLKISSPVAFTSIPLDGDDPLNSASGLLNSPTSEDPPLSPMEAPFSNPGAGTPRILDGNLKVPRYFPSNNSQSLPRPTKPRADPSPMQESFFIIDSPTSKNAQSKNPLSRSRSTSASESSTLSSSGPYKSTSSGLRKGETAPRNATKTLEEYAIENQQLKLTLDKLSRRNLKLEKHLEGVMQMSVWTKDVQRSAMQLIKSQDILRPVKQSIQDLSAEKGGAPSQRAQALAVPPSSTPTTPSSATSYDQMNPMTMRGRLAELEEEVQKLRLENAKQNSLMKKYKQRWEDLKESAKRRRNAPLAANDDHTGAGGDSPENGGNHISTAESQVHHRPLHQGASSSSGTGPYSNLLLGSPSNNINAGNPRPLATLARSSSASGPVLSAGGSYQRRILMDIKAGSMLDSTPLSVQHHRQASSSGTVPSTSSRTLDPASTKVTGSSSPAEGSPSAVPRGVETSPPAPKNHATAISSSSSTVAPEALNEGTGSSVGVIKAQGVGAAEGDSASPLSSSTSGSSQKSAASAPSPSDSSLTPGLDS